MWQQLHLLRVSRSPQPWVPALAFTPHVFAPTPHVVLRQRLTPKEDYRDAALIGSPSRTNDIFLILSRNHHSKYTGRLSRQRTGYLGELNPSLHLCQRLEDLLRHCLEVHIIFTLIPFNLYPRLRFIKRDSTLCGKDPQNFMSWQRKSRNGVTSGILLTHLDQSGAIMEGSWIERLIKPTFTIVAWLSVYLSRTWRPHINRHIVRRRTVNEMIWPVVVIITLQMHR